MLIDSQDGYLAQGICSFARFEGIIDLFIVKLELRGTEVTNKHNQGWKPPKSMMKAQ